jgi:DNA-binding SARP family transcriptional activator
MTGPRSEAALLDRFVKDASSVGVLEVGTRHGELASLELTRWGTVNLVGPGAHDPSLGDSNVHAILRAWCAALLAGGERRFSEVLTTAEVFDNLFPALNPVPALRIAASPDGLLRAVEAEILNRARVLDEADVPNARAYRDVRPEDPLPFLLVVAAQVLQTQRDRWRAIAGGGARLGISVLAIESGVGWGAQIIVDADCVVTAASPADLDQQLRHFTLFSLNAPEATELLRIVNAQSTDAEEDEPSDATVPSRGPNEWVDDDWPIDDQNLTTRSARPINVRLLGPYQISAHGAEVTSGLRTAAKELLAWYLLRPEGASAEAAVDGLWPDTMPDLVTKRFWRALGDLRTRLRNDDAGAKVNLLVRSGNHYHVNGEEISCDLWEFQDQLTDAARADDEVATVVALRSAVDLFKGDFVSDVDYLWAEPVREDLHRRALDAHLRLAELEEASGRADAAADVLGRAVRLDRYAEEVFRRLMALQGRMGNKDAITATWAQLQRNLVELGLDPEPSTARLYQTLRHDSEGPSSKPDQLPRR